MHRKVVLFDMNGVLISDEPIHEEAFRTVLGELGYELSSDEYLEYFIGKTDRAGYEDFFKSKNDFNKDIDELVRRKTEIYMGLTSGGVKPYPGLRSFLEALRKRGYRMAVVTGALRVEVEKILNLLQIDEYFNGIVSAEDVIRSKPNPEGYLKGASLMKVLPEECIVIEDTPVGVRAANSAEMFSVAVANTHRKEDLGEADLVVASLSVELVKELDGLHKRG